MGRNHRALCFVLIFLQGLIRGGSGQSVETGPVSYAANYNYESESNIPVGMEGGGSGGGEEVFPDKMEHRTLDLEPEVDEMDQVPMGSGDQPQQLIHPEQVGRMGQEFNNNANNANNGGGQGSYAGDEQHYPQNNAHPHLQEHENQAQDHATGNAINNARPPTPTAQYRPRISKEQLAKRRRKLKRFREQQGLSPALSPVPAVVPVQPPAPQPSPPTLLARGQGHQGQGQGQMQGQIHAVVKQQGPSARNLQAQVQYQAYQQLQQQQHPQGQELFVQDSRQIQQQHRKQKQTKFPEYPHHKQRNNAIANNGISNNGAPQQKPLEPVAYSTMTPNNLQPKTFRQYQVPLNQYYGNTFNYQTEPQPLPPQGQFTTFNPQPQPHHHPGPAKQSISTSYDPPVSTYVMPVLGRARGQGQGQPQAPGPGQGQFHTQESRAIPQYRSHNHYNPHHRQPHHRQHRQPHHNHRQQRHFAHRQSQPLLQIPPQIPHNNHPHPHHHQQSGQPRQSHPNQNLNHPQFQAPVELMQPSMTNNYPSASSSLGHPSGGSRGHNHFRSRTNYDDEEDHTSDYYSSNGYTPGSGDSSYGPPSSSPYDSDPLTVTGDRRKKQKKRKGSPPPKGGKKEPKVKVIEGDPEAEDPDGTDAKEASFPVRVYRKTKNAVVNTASAVFGAPKYIYTRYKKAYNNLGGSKKRSSKGPTKEVATAKGKGQPGGQTGWEEYEEGYEDDGQYYSGGGGNDADAESQWRLHAPVKYEDTPVTNAPGGWGWGGRSLARRGGEEGSPYGQRLVRRRRPHPHPQPNRMGRLPPHPQHPVGGGRRMMRYPEVEYAGGGDEWQEHPEERERLLSLPARNWNHWTGRGRVQG